MKSDALRRFSPLEIALHWAQAIPYLVLFVTGGVMLVQRFLAVELVAHRNLSQVHRLAGVLLLVVLLQVLITAVFSGTIRAFLSTLREAVSWRWRDIVWLLNLPLNAITSRVLLPPVGRLNPGQKLQVLLVITLLIGFAGTGITILLSPGILGAWALHAILFVPACGLLAAHIFLTLINAPTRIALTSVLTGFVPLEYAQKHHPLWVNHSGPAEPHRMLSWRAILFAALVLCAALTGAAWAYGPARLKQRILVVAGGYGAELIMPGKLCASHAKDPKARACTSCHSLTAPPSSAACLSCHGKIQMVMSHQIGYHGTLSGECRSCHAEHAGENADIRGLDPVSFNHNRARFPLDGKHREVPCEKCHVLPGDNPQSPKVTTYIGLRFSACSDCHPNPHENNRAFNCARCHTTRSWKRPYLLFDHERDSSFHLRGKHAELQCEKCHQRTQWTGTKTVQSFHLYGLGTQCAQCHKDPHQATLGDDCSRCHTQNSWRGRDLLFVHNRDSRYPLFGAHLITDCKKCHPPEEGRPLATARFREIETACTACHRDPHEGQFQKTCTDCHNETDWKGRWVVDSHGAGSRYPLTGAHATVKCVKCHPLPSEDAPLGQARFSGTSTACDKCHKDPHRGQMRSPCSACHNTTAWKAPHLLFAHNKQSEFALDANHSAVPCASCHKQGPAAVYRPLPKTCEGCHVDIDAAIRAVPQQTNIKADPHAGRVACAQCHTQTQRRQTSADFAAACRSCHTTHHEALYYDWLRSLRDREARVQDLIETLKRNGKTDQAIALARKLARAKAIGLHNIALARALMDEMLR